MDPEPMRRLVELQAGSFVPLAVLALGGATQLARGGVMFALADTGAVAGALAAAGTGAAAVIAAIGMLIERLQNPRIGRLEDRLDRFEDRWDASEKVKKERHEDADRQRAELRTEVQGISHDVRENIRQHNTPDPDAPPAHRPEQTP